MQEFTIFGIRVKDYTQKETIKILSEYLDNGGLNTVSYLNTEILVEAEADEESKHGLTDLDMTIIAEPDIMKAANYVDHARLKEVGNGYIMKNLIHKIAKLRMEVYLITDSNQSMIELEKEIKELQPSIKICGRFILEEHQQEVNQEDVMVNEMNDVTPTVIFSRLPFQKQLRIMSQNKKRINAELWVGLLQGVKLLGNKKHARTKINSFFYRKLFHRKIQRYKSDNAN